jgi:hypothetical protein
MLHYIEPFPGYSRDEDFVLRLLDYAEKWAASDVRLASDGQATKWDFLIKGEWKAAGVPPPPQRLWGFVVQGAMSLLQLPDWLPDNCEGLIQSDVLKAKWLFHGSDVNRELCFRQYNAPGTNDSSA